MFIDVKYAEKFIIHKIRKYASMPVKYIEFVSNTSFNLEIQQFVYNWHYSKSLCYYYKLYKLLLLHAII